MSHAVRTFPQDIDLLVIGGGVNGCGIAWDAALRGLRVALIDQSDFGSETSAAAFKILHGGVRYLQHLDIARLLQSAEEQRILRRIAPHLVQPLSICLPTYGFGKRGGLFLRAGFSLYDAITFWKNSNVDPALHLPFHSRINVERLAHIAPGLDLRGVTGGVLFSDCQLSSPERFTYLLARSAENCGAAIFNYAEAVAFETKEEQGTSETKSESRSEIKTVVVRDRLTDREHRIDAKVIVNAAGPWTRRLWSKLRGWEELRSKPVAYSKGIQLVLPALTTGHGVALESGHYDTDTFVVRGGRSYFVVPWRGLSLVGTTEEYFDGDPASFSIGDAEIEAFLSELRQIYRSELLQPEAVRHAFGGLRAVDSTFENDTPPEAIGSRTVSRKDVVFDHSVSNSDIPNVRNLISVSGVKYTTFRHLAERVVDIVVGKLDRQFPPSRTSRTQIHGGEFPSIASLRAELDEQAKRSGVERYLPHLISSYGSATRDLLALLMEQPELGTLVPGSSDTLKAEIVFSAREPHTHTLGDIVMRRTGLGTIGNPGDDGLYVAASLAMSELGWDRSRVDEEIQAIRRKFPVTSRKKRELQKAQGLA